MKLRVVAACAALVVGIALLAACTTPIAAAPPYVEAPLLPGPFIRVATANQSPIGSDSPAAQVERSDNGRWIAYVSSDPGVTGEPDEPDSPDLFVYDWQTGTTARVTLGGVDDGIPRLQDIRDDGAVLFHTVQGGDCQDVRCTWTPTDGVAQLEVTSGYECNARFAGSDDLLMLCWYVPDPAVLRSYDLSTDTFTDLYTLPAPISQTRTFTFSSNQRWFTFLTNEPWLWDSQTGTLTELDLGGDPSSYALNPLHKVDSDFVRRPMVGDDGVVTYERQVVDFVLQSIATYTHDPATEEDAPLLGIEAARYLEVSPDDDWVTFDDYTGEIGSNYLSDNRPAWYAYPVVASASHPSVRYRLPIHWALNTSGVAPDGSIMLVTEESLDPSDTSPGWGVYVRPGPMP